MRAAQGHPITAGSDAFGPVSQCGAFPKCPHPLCQGPALAHLCLLDCWTDVGGSVPATVTRLAPKDDIEAQRGPVRFLRSHSTGQSSCLPVSCGRHFWVYCVRVRPVTTPAEL